MEITYIKYFIIPHPRGIFSECFCVSLIIQKTQIEFKNRKKTAASAIYVTQYPIVDSRFPTPTQMPKASTQRTPQAHEYAYKIYIYLFIY